MDNVDLVEQFGCGNVESALIVAHYVRDYVEAELAKDGGVRISTTGICDLWSEFADSIGAANRWTRKARDTLYHEWPHFSGDRLYPVPCPLSMIDAYEEYILSHRNPSTAMGKEEFAFNRAPHMWDGEYGESRMACLVYIIDRLEAALK
ncbi:hypothetical protein Paz_03 [Xylella phage Paz]|uniref:Uncharacterized protein n=1 Tax=Xylella phage Paz TaxID=1415145 RepID=V5Q9J5_9CAUD|nr:hypothetical protein Paz_03 [Xylella phage Paz]AHB12100.1 hypothetical protein Paz_03 [Xylella phage Paz]